MIGYVCVDCLLLVRVVGRILGWFEVGLMRRLSVREERFVEDFITGAKI